MFSSELEANKNNICNHTLQQNELDSNYYAKASLPGLFFASTKAAESGGFGFGGGSGGGRGEATEELNSDVCVVSTPSRRFVVLSLSSSIDEYTAVLAIVVF